MAKKKKYINRKLEQEELTPIVIGIQEDKKKNSIGIFLILAVFIGAVFFMPQISNMIHNLLNKPPVTPGTSVNPNPNIPDHPVVENPDLEMYDYSETLKIDRTVISVQDFKVSKEDQTIQYQVTNKNNMYQDLEQLNYFLEIYNSDKTLIERVKLATGGIGASASKTYIKNITSTSADSIGYLMLVAKKTSDYPDITISTDQNNNGNLVCKRENETVTYKFQENKLKEVASIIEYASTADNYLELLSKYKNLSSAYNTTGITSNFYNNESGFSVTTIVNLNEASRKYIFNADTFKLNTEPSVVSFEMEAQNFTCE